MNLKNKMAVVTGASSGLGAATVRALMKENVIVYGIARSEDKLRAMQESMSGLFHPVVMDLGNGDEIRNWVSETFNYTYFPQILINNAGVSKFDEVDAIPPMLWHNMIDINLSAVHHMTSALVPLMKSDENSAHIINIGSVLGTVSGSKKSAYSATKFAIQGYSEALFKELRGYNIKVTCFNPGSINTHFFKSSGIQPNKQMLHPQDVADILVFLLKTPDNVLVDELTVRPLRPKKE